MGLSVWIFARITHALFVKAKYGFFSIPGSPDRSGANDVVAEITTTVLSNVKEPNRYRNYQLRKAFLMLSAARVRKGGIFPNNS